MKFSIFVSLCLILDFALAAKVHYNGIYNKRDSRKLFGGYRITPRFCEATKKTNIMSPQGPNICMFNHECQERDGQVVGACMDGFLFGACCNLPTEVSIGELLSDDTVSIGNIENNVAATMKPYTTAISDFTSNGVSQLSALLQNGILPTAQDNEMVQLSSDQHFGTTGVTHSDLSDTIILNQQNNEIDPIYFASTRPPNVEDRKTTVRTNELFNSPIVAISISNAPLEYTTPITEFTNSLLRPKPLKPSNTDKYILVPTIDHQTMSANKTQEFDSIVNILHMLNNTSTNRPSISSSTHRYPNSSYASTIKTPELNSNKVALSKPPSTSYVFSTTIPPRRPDVTTTNKKPQKTEKPNTTKTQSTTSYIYNVSPSKTTFASSSSMFSTPAKPPSTSYIYSLKPTKRPDSHVGISSVSSPPPTLIVLGPVTESTVIADQGPTTYQQQSVTIHRPTAIPQRKPINHVTINNHVTQNIFSTSDKPSPTVLITPKPSTSFRPQESDTVEVGTISPSSPSDNANFPPVRHPNLNMSNIALLSENDITTPVFLEDEALNSNVESFVNKIIESLQEPFQDLKQVVYNKNKTSTTSVTKKKPVRKQGTSTVRPVTVKATKPNNSIRTSTNRPPTTKKVITKGTTAVPTKKYTATTFKRTKPTKSPSTTAASFIELETDSIPIDSEDYRTQCGIRPLMKTGRIVGGKGASFGEYPWQVLVRESTWLGLFTKNKCGGVLISHKYVMTAAHCQPGFLASLVAVFGEFDISGELETKRSISRNVKRVIVHRQYDAATFENDLALLELEQPVQFDAHIVPICLPRDSEDLTGRMATVTGWGRLKYGGGVPSVLQVVQVPIMENHVCQEMFRTAGHSKVILDSFLCAGYANGQKDSCEGDSGGPLVLQRPDGRYQLAGTVSHGIKCAAPYLPGVYMRTQFFKPWITSITGVTSP